MSAVAVDDAAFTVDGIRDLVPCDESEAAAVDAGQLIEARLRQDRDRVHRRRDAEDELLVPFFGQIQRRADQKLPAVHRERPDCQLSDVHALVFASTSFAQRPGSN